LLGYGGGARGGTWYLVFVGREGGRPGGGPNGIFRGIDGPMGLRWAKGGQGAGCPRGIPGQIFLGDGFFWWGNGERVGERGVHRTPLSGFILGADGKGHLRGPAGGRGPAIWLGRGFEPNPGGGLPVPKRRAPPGLGGGAGNGQKAGRKRTKRTIVKGAKRIYGKKKRGMGRGPGESLFTGEKSTGPGSGPPVFRGGGNPPGRGFCRAALKGFWEGRGGGSGAGGRKAETMARGHCRALSHQRVHWEKKKQKKTWVGACKKKQTGWGAPRQIVGGMCIGCRAGGDNNRKTGWGGKKGQWRISG